MIFLTGDVHNMTLRDQHQLALVGMSEVDTAIKYAKIAADCGVTVNLFVTGRAVIEEPRGVAELNRMPNVELGGHGWDSFMRRRLRACLRLSFGSLYGPERLQRSEVSATLKAFESVTGQRPLVWRNHACYADDKTYSILAHAGIRVVSDEVNPSGRIHAMPEGLLSVPINTPPDHISLVHGAITQEFAARDHQNWLVQNLAFGGNLCGVRRLTNVGVCRKTKLLAIAATRRLFCSICTQRSVSVGAVWLNGPLVSGKEWIARLKALIPEQQRVLGHTTILAHPVCMQILDEMQTFEELCRMLGRTPTMRISDVLGAANLASVMAPEA